MPRVKSGVAHHARKKKIMKAAKGGFQARSKLYKAAKENELTGSIYRASAPAKQVYKPTEWNTVKIELKGSKLKATINGELVQDIDLDKFDKPTLRLDNKTEAPPLKDRPRKGHIGFQHLSRNNEPIEIRKVRVTELK